MEEEGIVTIFIWRHSILKPLELIITKVDTVGPRLVGERRVCYGKIKGLEMIISILPMR